MVMYNIAENIYTLFLRKLVLQKFTLISCVEILSQTMC